MIYCRIAVIGNAGGGKTEFSRLLSTHLSLPLFHVDSIQFLPGMQIRPHKESIAMLNEIQTQEKWLIDGFGPLDILEKRLDLADLIVFIDFPLWRHYWWCFKRQVKNFWLPRTELPIGCHEVSLSQTVKLFKTVAKVHKLMRPEMLRILRRDKFRMKTIRITNLQQWNAYSTNMPQVPIEKQI